MSTTSNDFPITTIEEVDDILNSPSYVMTEEDMKDHEENLREKENWREARSYTKAKPREEQQDSVLIGEPIPWSKLTEEENKKEWLWENYIAKGNITLLSALWKAGKTTFLRCLFLAMKNGEEFAGQPTTLCKVLVLSEEAKGEWADSREDIEDSEIENILVWSRPIRGKPNVKAWEKLVTTVKDKCIKENIELVIIDTLSTFWPIDNENDSAQVMKALVPLYNFTENNIAVLLVHHFRKGGGTEAQASRGSGALTGYVDNIIEFTRNKDGLPNQRLITTYGRFESTIVPIVIEYNNDGKYITKGEPWQVSKKARKERVLQIFDNSKEPLTARDVHNLWITQVGSISYRSIQRIIKEIATENFLDVVKKDGCRDVKTPFYARNGWKEAIATDLATPVSGILSRSSEQLPLSRSLSRSSKNQLHDRDTTGIIVAKGNDLSRSKLSDINLDEEEEIPF